MDISSLSFKDLVDKINKDLGNDFCDTFRYKRKELSNSGRASSYGILFKFVKEGRDWVINEGGGTEIQFHLYYRENTIGYGLGFNAQYIRFATNEKAAVEYIIPFVKAFLSLKSQKDEAISSLEKDGFSLIEGDWEGLKNIAPDEYYLFGKEIQIHNDILPDSEYNRMIENIKNDLFKLYVSVWKEKNEMEKRLETIEQYTNLLTKNHNLILTGAPGTGKTYLAKEIAKGMGCSDDEIGFVQFHPSYDYTDFVEGLRPKQDDNGNVVFERKDGVFKKFCKKAIAKETTEENKFDEIWDKFIADIRVKLSNGELTKIGNWEYGLSTKDSLKYSSINTPSQYSFTITKKNILDTYCGRQARPSGAFQKDMLDIVQHLKQTYNLSDKPEQTDSGDKTTKQYVFIIDEINRGEISKIFGELFFSIDPGYRGTDGKVKTQYQNLIDEDDEFFDGFYVPENVYIIGTMNDIDRSVESMDFAFRRRFAFKEIKAIDRIEMLYDAETGIGEYAEKAKNRMIHLNEEIEKIEGLSSAYHVGPAYFLKLKNYNGDFNQLWEYHLDGLLREYLRGMQNVDDSIKKLKEAYDKSNNTSTNGSDSNN